MKKQMTWLEFIIQNFKAGTAKEIGIHITNEAKQKGFMPDNKNVDAKVRQILPMYTDNRFKPTTTSRKQMGRIFYYDQRTKIYYLASDLIASIDIENLEFISKEPLSKNKESSKDEKILFERVKDLSAKHQDLVKLVYDYAKANGYQAAAESRKYKNIDVLMKKDNKYFINEIKTYKNSIYLAVGQVQFYKYQLITDKTLGIKEEDIAELNIVGDFEINEKFNDFLKSLNIRYVKVRD